VLVLAPWDRELDPEVGGGRSWPTAGSGTIPVARSGTAGRDVAVVVPTPYSLVGDEAVVQVVTVAPIARRRAARGAPPRGTGTIADPAVHGRLLGSPGDGSTEVVPR
jgi:hypothetical protein